MNSEPVMWAPGRLCFWGCSARWQGAVATVADVARAVRTAGSPNPLGHGNRRRRPEGSSRGSWASRADRAHRLPLGRPGAHQSPAHADARWRRDPGRPCRADCAGVPHHRPLSPSPTAPAPPSWRHSSLPRACTISLPARERRPQSISKIGRCSKIATRHDAALTGRAMERRDLRAVDPSMQAVIRDDHDLSALLHAGERHHVPRVAEAFRRQVRAASRSARWAPKTGRGIRQRLACRRRRSVGPEQRMSRSSSARCRRSPKGQPGKREARAEGAS